MKLTKKAKLLILVAALLLAVTLISRIFGTNDTDTLENDAEAPQSALVLLTEAPEAPELEPTDEPILPDAEEPEPETVGEEPVSTEAPTPTPEPTATPKPTATPAAIDRDGEYTKKDDVALYLHIYGTLPKNFITKNEARDLGWTGGGLDDYAYGCSIGGDHFGNYEGLLPTKKGRTYRECDIGTMHKSSRGAKRIIYSNDGLIYYTGDHYESFTLLYGEE